MSDSTKINSESTTDDSSKSTVNSQIIDSIKQINELIKDQSGDLKTVSDQVLTEAASMAMLNLVNQQQQMYMLQNTVTTVAVKAMLESNPEEAVKLMNSIVESNNIAKDLNELKNLLVNLNQ